MNIWEKADTSIKKIEVCKIFFKEGSIWLIENRVKYY